MKRYTRLTLKEREEIYLLQKNNHGIREIAERLNRSPSTISREIYRNRSDIGYLPDRAQDQTTNRRKNKDTKLDKNPELKEYIISRLTEDKWPPEAISAVIKLEKEMSNISHETIYKFIYSKEGLRLKLYQHLMYRRPERQAKFSRVKRYQVPEEKRIENRPEAINNRSEFGHGEADLTFFKGSNSKNIITTIERVSRMVKLANNNNKETNSTINKVRKIAKEMGYKSLTFDNGTEFTRYASLELTGTKVYFCKPHSPWEKGSIERMHVFLHKYIPKKTNINEITQKRLQWAEDKLNNLPRKSLGYLTPKQYWDNIKNQTVALEA
jgi:IS30 family transposase